MHTGDHAGIDAGPIVRRQQAPDGNGIEENSVEIADLAPRGTGWIEIGDADGEFGEADRAMEQQRALDQQVCRFRQRSCRRADQPVSGPRSTLSASFVGLMATQQCGAKIRAQACGSRRACHACV